MTWFPVLVVAALAYAQWRVTSPGVITDVEFRTLLLAEAPALSITLCARWVDAGARPFDTRRDT